MTHPDSGRYRTPAIRLDESGMWVLRKYHEAEIERLLAVLKAIAESPESRDALQVRAWQTYQQESPEWVLADDPQNPANQVPDFSKGKS